MISLPLELRILVYDLLDGSELVNLYRVLGKSLVELRGFYMLVKECKYETGHLYPLLKIESLLSDEEIKAILDLEPLIKGIMVTDLAILIKAIAQGIRKITHVFLKCKYITAATSRELVNALTRSSTPCRISHLDLSVNDIGAIGAKEISKLIRVPRSTITHLFLAHNNIGVGGVKALSGTIKHGNSRLQSLHLEYNNIKHTGTEILVDALVSLRLVCTLTLLNLENNSIGDVGAQAVANCPSCITHFYLGNNKIGDAGFKALIQLFHDRSSIHMHLNNNRIGDAGALAFSNTLLLLLHGKVKMQRNIELNLEGNEIGDAGGLAIIETVQSIGSMLVSLKLGRNHFGISVIDVAKLSSLTRDFIVE